MDLPPDLRTALGRLLAAAAAAVIVGGMSVSTIFTLLLLPSLLRLGEPARVARLRAGRRIGRHPHRLLRIAR